MVKNSNYKDQYVNGVFTDYLGRERHFIVCALSMPCFNINGEYHVMDKDIIDTNDTIAKRFHDAMSQVSEELYATGFIEIKRPKLDNPVCGVVVREIRFGVAVLRADDEYNDELGKEMAYGKALKSKLAMYVTDKRLISQLTVDAMLKQQAAYIIENPDEYIKPYAEEHMKWISNNPCKANVAADIIEPEIIGTVETCCQKCKCNKNFTFSDPNIQDVEYVEVKE